jgi:hypothetical protein
MKKFIVMYHAPVSALEAMVNVSPEDAKESMEPWFEWQNKVGSGMVDLGNPLGNGMKVTKSGVSASEKEVIGYSILQADSIEEAVKLLDGHPHLEWMESCSIEIHESLPLPG